MLKYLVGLVVLLGAGVLAYGTYGRFHPDEAVLQINTEILRAAERMHLAQDTASDALPIVPEGEVGDAAVPLFIGALWRYRSADSREPNTPRTWLFTVNRAPDAATPGISSAGFEGKSEVASIVDRDGDLRLDGLGFFAPPVFTDVPPVQVEGETLPRNLRIVEGAVWELRIRRKVTYQIATPKGETKERKGEATERHRALAGKLETVTVPKGKFNARRIDWLSRLELKTEGRPVLMPLTTEPYRKETMWVVPGIGIVKRSISFLTEEGKGTVLLELESGPSK